VLWGVLACLLVLLASGSAEELGVKYCTDLNR